LKILDLLSPGFAHWRTLKKFLIGISCKVSLITLLQQK